MTHAKKQQAVVVGATGAIGKVIVRRLVNEGWTVIAVARDPQALTALTEANEQVRACAVDIASDASIDAIQALVDGPVGLVVHGAGVATAGGVMTVPVDALNEAVNIKVGGLLRAVRAVDSRLQHRARLVAIGGHYGFEPSAYASTAGVANAALANLVRQLSWAYGGRGITAHLLAPGPADTDRLRRVAAARADREGRGADEMLDLMRDESAIGAFTTTEQIAWAVSMLTMPEADAFAGSTLFMDAGRRRGLP